MICAAPLPLWFCMNPDGKWCLSNRICWIIFGHFREGQSRACQAKGQNSRCIVEPYPMILPFQCASCLFLATQARGHFILLFDLILIYAFFINPAIVRGKVNQGKGIYYFTAWCWALPWAMHAYSFRSILPSIIAHVSNTIIIIMMMVFYVGVSIWSNLCYHMSLHDAVTFYYHIVIFAVLFVCSNSFPSFPCEQVHSLVTSSSSNLPAFCLNYDCRVFQPLVDFPWFWFLALTIFPYFSLNYFLFADFREPNSPRTLVRRSYWLLPCFSGVGDFPTWYTIRSGEGESRMAGSRYFETYVGSRHRPWKWIHLWHQCNSLFLE